jgi:hypothetical protein
MKRRDALLLTGAALAAPRRAIAQPGGRMRRIGVLMGGAGADPETQTRLGGV